MMRTIFCTLLLLFSYFPRADAAIPAAAVSDSRYAMGYLVCDHYAGVTSDGTGDSTNGLNECIHDAYMNQLTSFLGDGDGVYLITSTLKAYEWILWNTAQNRAYGAAYNNHVFRGSTSHYPTRPTIKIKTGSTYFASAGSPRPMYMDRSFWPENENVPSNCNSNVNATGCQPATPYTFPPNYRSGGGVNFVEYLENIDFDTNGHAGAIGFTVEGGQGCLVANSKVTATGSLIGVYSPPGRNSVMANIEVVGGQYCIASGSILGLPIQTGQGMNLHGIKCTNQTVRALYLPDGIPPVVTGFEITRSADGTPIELPSGGVLKDGKITMTGAAVNDVVIQNGLSDGRNLYLNEVFVSGSNRLLKNGTVERAALPNMSTWARIQEYVVTDQYSVDTNSSATVFPPYPYPPGQTNGRFEARSFIGPVTAGTALTLSGADAPIALISTSVQTVPPTDLHARHIWTRLPAIDDGPYVTPTLATGNCEAHVGHNFFDHVTKGGECKDEIHAAMLAAETAGHNRVHLPRGSLLINGKLSMRANTKLIGAGVHKNLISYKSTWNPTTAVPMLETTNSATDAPYAGFLTLYIKVEPITYDFMYFIRWRAGKNSMTVGMDYNSPFKCKCGGTCVPATNPNSTNQPRKALWFSDNGGGKHYAANFEIVSSFDRNSASRTFYFDNTTQPLSVYGFNVEGGKGFACGQPTTNNEALNASNLRLYGAKHEGNIPVLTMTGPKNIGLYGIGGFSIAPKNDIGFVTVTGTVTNPSYLIAPIGMRDNLQAQSLGITFKETMTGFPASTTAILWPNAVSVAKRGTMDDSVFTTGGAPPPAAPTFLSAEIIVANRVDACWDIFDSTAMLPSSGTSGWTVLVNGVSQSVTSSTRQGLNCYQLNFAGGTITSGTQSVVLSYTPGNITAGLAPNPSALAFSGYTATNSLDPVTAPFYTQTGFGIRSIHGKDDAASSPWYTSAAGVFENVALRAVPGGAVRVRIQASVTGGAAPPQSFAVYYNENEGTYVPLTNSCATENLCFADMPDLSDGNLLPTQMLTPTQATYVPCGVLESAAGQVSVTLPAGSETECEIGVQSKSSAALNNRYRVQLRRAGGAVFDSYPEAGIPLVTLVNPRASIVGGAVQ